MSRIHVNIDRETMSCQMKRQVYSTSSINRSYYKTMDETRKGYNSSLNEEIRPFVDHCRKSVDKGNSLDPNMKPLNFSTKLLLREEIRKSALRSHSFSSVDSSSRKDRHCSDSSDYHQRSNSFVNALLSRTVSYF